MSDSASSYTSERVHRSQRLHSILHRYKNVLRKHWWIPVLTVLIGLGIQGVRLWRTPPTFISIGQMIVNFKVSTPNASFTSISPVGENFLGTESTLMQSQRVLDRAAQLVRDRKPNLTPSYTVIKPTVTPKTTLFNLVAIGSDPAYTQAYLDAVMDAYLQVRQEMKEETADSYITGMRRELIRLQKELSQGDQELLDFQSSNSIVLLQEQGGKASSYLVELDNELSRLKTQHDLIQNVTVDQNFDMQRQMSTDSGRPDATQLREADTELFGATSDYLKLKQKILLKKAEQKQLSEYLRPKHPKMISLAQELNDQENLLQILYQQSGEQLTNNLASIDRRMKNIQNQIEEQKVKSLDISRQMAQYERIKSELDRNQQSYDHLLATLQQLELTRGSDAATVTLYKRATNPEPNIPNLFRSFLVGVLGGLSVGGLILFLMDRMDDRLNTFVELQDTFNESVLGQIPQEKPAFKNAPIRLLQPDDNRHAFVEAYRNLRSSLLYMATEGRRAKTLLVTSAVPGDGKSLTTANLAITLAQSGARVLLVDADLRKGLLHRHFGIETSVGLTEILTSGFDWQKTIVPTIYPKLFMITRGSICKNPGELFLKPTTYQMLNEMAEQYDYVIIDSAPVMAADDVASLSPHVEGVIFVVRANTTSARVARAAMDLLYQREVNILGIVFNGVEAQTSEYYFYKYKEYHGTRAKA